MKRLILTLIILSAMVIPASADTYNLYGSSGFDDLYIFDAQADKYVSASPNSYDVSALQYDSFVCAPSDEIYSIFIEMEDLSGSSTMPMTFHHRNTSHTLNVNFDVEERPYLIVFSRDWAVYTVSNSTGSTLLSGEVPADKVRIMMDESDFSIGASTMHSMNTQANGTLLPARAVEYDITNVQLKEQDLNKNVKAYAWSKLSYQDTATYDDLEGGLKYIYAGLSFLDHDRVIYSVFFYLQLMVTYAIFTIGFFIHSTWLYVALANCAGLAYAILQKRKGQAAMIQGYAYVLKEAILLPFNIAKFFITLVMRLASAITNLIPFT
ncbi:hypothetical protein EFE42_01190 [Methanohalophilus sp. RSK]|uniref:hypothetical protein n=1 Tax=Methanohalophilus sp. RSK TaxID=2485783 RepID=UPI000F43E4B5|nr:hypothetical protein [Methanohalophilus sp. RSK]RNI15882.1 hypothetical protein EFE42_01190 [Methanohalophilus sp. RSK]